MEKLRCNRSDELMQFFGEINVIGNNVLDLYIGNLTSAQIIEELTIKLESANIFNKESFELYLGNDGYKNIKLSDGSQWILRLANMKQKFIHVHPSRSGKFTTRISGAAWKTAITFILFEKEISNLGVLLNKVNFIRTKYLKLSPVKMFRSNSNILKTIGLLKNNPIHFNSIEAF